MIHGSRVVRGWLNRFQVHTNGNFQEVESLLDSNRFFFGSNKNGELSMDSFWANVFFLHISFHSGFFLGKCFFFCIPST